MQLQPVTSSTIKAVGYDPESQVLTVEFLNGGTYEYYNVAPQVFEEFRTATSKGAYLHLHIKARYMYRKLPTTLALAPSPVIREEKAASMEEQCAEAYTDRNLLAQLVAWIGERVDWRVYWMVDPAEPDWPVLAIELGAKGGQITYHIPRDEVIVRLPEVEGRWDGHTTEEKRERIRRFIAPGPPEA